MNVVNRHQDHIITADILAISGEFTGKAEATFITGKSLQDPYRFDEKEKYLPAVQEVKTEKNKITFSFPAHSFTQIKIEVEK
jgi:alpha-N-arabinofuranosidase